MQNLKLRRRFEQTLSEGQGMQLLWLIFIILIVFFVFWGIIVLVFHDSSMGWQDLIALFLDPGTFGGAGTHDVFRLTATIFGVFLFSALLISVISNIFENVALSFKNGHSRYHHHGHVLVLGGGNQLISIIFALLEKSDSSEIVVLTTLPVDELRARLFTLPFLDKPKYKALKKRLTLYYGNRDNETHLMRNNLARDARAIYIIGENEELDHDSVSIRCCKKLQQICRHTGKPVRCFMVLRDSATLDVYKYIKDAETSGDTDLKVDVIDANEYLAEQVLVGDHDGKDVVLYPKIDYRQIVFSDGIPTVIPGIRRQDSNYVHLLITGSSNMSRAFALTAAHLCHFPNFAKGARRTIISLIDSGMRMKMDRFVSSLPHLFKLSHYSYISFDDKGERILEKHLPDANYGDFLDIEWEFIDADIHSPHVCRLLEELAKDKDRSLSIALCQDEQKENTFAAIHLPRLIYDKGYPVFVYQKDYGDVLNQAKLTGQFGNIHTFGMASNIQDDPLFEFRSLRGQRVNYIYNKEYGEIKYPDEQTAWFTIPEAHKFSSIHCANAMIIRARSFGLDNRHDVSALTPDEQASIYEVEHRRWMMSALLLGYAPMDKAYLDEWKKRRLSADEDVKKAAKAEFRNLKNRMYIHLDITPYDDLIPDEQTKDKVIIDRLSYILEG